MTTRPPSSTKKPSKKKKVTTGGQKKVIVKDAKESDKPLLDSLGALHIVSQIDEHDPNIIQTLERINSTNESPANLKMSREDTIRLQTPLIERLNVKMASDKLTQASFAEKLNMSPAFVTAIFNGHRWVPKADRHFIDELAKYLEVPAVQIYIWSGFFAPHDMVSTINLAERLNLCYSQMTNDAVVRHAIPPREVWDSSDIKMKLSIVLIYEMLARTILLDHAEMEMSNEQIENIEWLLHNQKK